MSKYQKAEEADAALAQRISEARGVQKDIKATYTEARKWVAENAVTMTNQIAELVEEAAHIRVNNALNEFYKELRRLQQNAARDLLRQHHQVIGEMSRKMQEVMGHAFCEVCEPKVKTLHDAMKEYERESERLSIMVHPTLTDALESIPEGRLGIMVSPTLVRAEDVQSMRNG